MKMRNRNLLVDRNGKPLNPQAAGYRGAEIDRYNADLTTVAYNANDLIRQQAALVRARAQDLERNSDHTRRFLALLENNVVGWNGIRLQSKATRSERTDTPDRQAIWTVETEWAEFANDCTVYGDDALPDVEKLCLRRVFVDGEVFVELLPRFDNPSRFALRIWSADAISYQTDIDRGIIMGIEYDANQRPVAYLVNRSGDARIRRDAPDAVLRIPANQMIHLFRKHFAGQKRGISAFCSTVERIHMLESFERATLIGARIASSKMGFFRDPDGQTLAGYTGDGPEHEAGFTNAIDIQPGQFEDIGNKHFEKFDVEYPPAKYEEFTHEILRSVASGLNISYHVLANDPGSVNYSTAREFRLQDTDAYRDLQHWLARRLMQPVFLQWLEVQLQRPAFSRYKSSDFKRLSYVKWQPRGWQWVDPQKEANGNMLAVQMGVKSLTDVAAEQGKDYEEVIEQIQRDREYAEQHGVDLSAVWQAVATPTEPASEE